MTSTNVDTKHAERRQLRFESIDDVRREIDRIVAAEQAGTLRITGNWSPGQAFGHLASWINYGWDGYPPELQPNWIVRLLLRRLVKRIAHDGYPAGSRIPRIAEGTFATQVFTTEDGARRLRDALDRLERREPVQFHSPAFGQVSDDVRIAMQLRHAELHLSFFWPEAS